MPKNDVRNLEVLADERELLAAALKAIHIRGGAAELINDLGFQVERGAIAHGLNERDRLLTRVLLQHIARKTTRKAPGRPRDPKVDTAYQMRRKKEPWGLIFRTIGVSQSEQLKTRAAVYQRFREARRNPQRNAHSKKTVPLSSSSQTGTKRSTLRKRPRKAKGPSKRKADQCEETPPQQ